MLGLLADVVIDIALHVAGIGIRAAVSKAAVPASSKRIAVASNKLVERRAAYARWAADHGFVEDDVRSHIFHGEKSGRRLRFLTGLATNMPSLPEIEIEHPSPHAFPAIVIAPGGPRPSGVERAIVAVVDREQVVQIDVTRKLVRISYERMVRADLLDEPFDALLRALSPTISTTAYR